jgi:hypothetical protein
MKEIQILCFKLLNLSGVPLTASRIINKQPRGYQSSRLKMTAARKTKYYICRELTVYAKNNGCPYMQILVTTVFMSSAII